MYSRDQQCFLSKVAVPFAANLPRVNKNFDTVCHQRAILYVRYPVEMSAVSHAFTISSKKELPVAIQLRNISNKPIGSNTKEQRLLKLKLSISKEQADCGDYLHFSGKKNIDSWNLSKPFIQDITLQAGETTCFSGTLKIDDMAMAEYTTLSLSFTLSLGDLHNKKIIEDIQRQDFTIQLANEYRYHPAADFLLVTNCNTSKEIVDKWKDIVSEFGSSLCVWNVSLYSGLSYFQKRENSSSFETEWQDKVVIILDDKYSVNNKRRLKATDYLDTKELFVAAQKAHVSTYVIGRAFNLKHAVSPPLAIAENDTFPLTSRSRHIAVTDYFVKWNKPTTKHLKQKAVELSKRLQHEAPSNRSVMVLNWYPTKMKSGLRDQWQLGSVQFVYGLARVETRIAHRDKIPDIVDQEDVFNIIKLLPFIKKLNYIVRSNARFANLNLLSNAILADLTDELLSFSRNTWLQSMSKKRISSALSLLNQLDQFDFCSIKLSIAAQDSLRKLLVKYYYLATRIVTKSDELLFSRQKYRYVLAQICHERIMVLYEKNFPGNDLHEDLEQLANRWKKIRKSDLFGMIVNPHSRQTAYDNHEGLRSLIFRDRIKPHHPKVSRFKESLHFFASKDEREACIDAYERRCRFTSSN